MAVSHTKLCSVLKSNDIMNNTFNWICTFIDKCQCVSITNALPSFFLPVTIGASQGSVLGPLVFNIYNLTAFCHFKDAVCCMFLYADDAKIL